MATIKDILTGFIRSELKNEEFYAQVGTVSNVRESEALCDFTPDEGTKIFDVKLNVALNVTTGFIIVPKDGVRGIVQFFNRERALLVRSQEIEKILIVVGNSTIEIKDDEILFNGGTNEGLINIVDLVTKLNNLENDINTLKTAFSTWVTVPSDGGAALKAITATWAGSSLTPTQKADIEDDKILH